MTRASDTARLVGAGGTIANDITLSEGSPSIKLNDTDTSRFIDILYGTRVATFRNTMASSEDMDTVAPETVFSIKDDGETREHFRMNKTESVFNEGSVDLNFRVESNANANMIFVDAGNDRIGINQGTPLQPLHLTDADFAFARFETTAVSKTGMDVGQHQDGTGHINMRDANHIKISTADTERVRIKDDGNTLIGTTSTTPNPGVAAFPAGQFAIGKNNSNDNSVFIEFRRNASQIGGVVQDGTTGVSYNTSSDYRLKENVAYNFDATTRLKQLKPCRFNFIAEADRTVDGFIAHEVSSVVPEAISGTKDAMIAEVLYVDDDEIPDGKKVGDVKEASTIDPQQIDQSKLVPLLVKTIQELEARITTLENA